MASITDGGVVSDDLTLDAGVGSEYRPLLSGRAGSGSSSGVAAALDREVRHLGLFLSLLGFPASSSSPTRALASSATFLLLGVALPVAALAFAWCAGGDSSRCSAYEVEQFEIGLLVTELSAAAVAFVSIARSLGKYGIQRFLFVDQQQGQVYRQEYHRKIKDFYALVAWWICPCLVVKVAREACRFTYIVEQSKWRAVTVLLASTVSWTYLNAVFLSSCALFRLVINLQVVHFDDFGKLLEQDLDTLAYVQEHFRLCHNLVKISHRFRMFLLLSFLCVAATQFVSLFETTGYVGLLNFTTGGELIVSCLIQMVGIVTCLQAAAKMSRRAQGIASTACRWHALVTCSSSDPDFTNVRNGSENVEPFRSNSVRMNYSESDSESLDGDTANPSLQLVSYMSTYHKRQALVMYLTTNASGLTVYGWTVDRALLLTLFFVELTLVSFVLGKTIIFTR